MKPFYVIAHRVNSPDEIETHVEKGANAIELDISVDDGVLEVSHGNVTNPAYEIENYFEKLVQVATDYPSLALIIFDCKFTGYPQFALQLFNLIRSEITSRVPLNIVLSIGRYDDRNFFLPIIEEGLTEREGLAIDEDNEPLRVINFFEEHGISNYCYGNGIATIAPGPKVPNSILDAIKEKALRQNAKMVYVWTIRNESSFRNYLRMGVDGIMINENRIDNLLSVFNDVEFEDSYRLATREDNPFLPIENSNYVLRIHTSDRKYAGTNANLFFTLTGTDGELTASIDSDQRRLFERNKTNFITIFGNDIGNILSLNISRDTNNRGPGWHVGTVQIESTTTSLTTPKWLGYDSWIPTRERGGLTRNSGTLWYRITVRTSNRFKSGTDANVLFEFFGTGTGVGSPITLPYRISGDGGIFERGKTNQRTFSGDDIGDINRLRISHDGSGNGPDWRVNWVLITVMRDIPSDFIFSINQELIGNRPITFDI